MFFFHFSQTKIELKHQKSNSIHAAQILYFQTSHVIASNRLTAFSLLFEMFLCHGEKNPEKQQKFLDQRIFSASSSSRMKVVNNFTKSFLLIGDACNSPKSELLNCKRRGSFVCDMPTMLRNVFVRSSSKQSTSSQ
jgi:hypothetical protein